MQHSKPNTSKANTTPGYVPEKTHGLGGGRAKGTTRAPDMTGGTTVGNLGKVALGPINPKGAK